MLGSFTEPFNCVKALNREGRDISIHIYYQSILSQHTTNKVSCELVLSNWCCHLGTTGENHVSTQHVKSTIMTWPIISNKSFSQLDNLDHGLSSWMFDGTTGAAQLTRHLPSAIVLFRSLPHVFGTVCRRTSRLHPRCLFFAFVWRRTSSDAAFRDYIFCFCRACEVTCHNRTR